MSVREQKRRFLENVVGLNIATRDCIERLDGGISVEIAERTPYGGTGTSERKRRNGKASTGAHLP